MYSASIHTDRGEEFALLHPDGFPGGKALLTFVHALERYNDAIQANALPSAGSARQIVEWFSQLSAGAGESISQLGQHLSNSYFVGEYNQAECALLMEKAGSSEIREYAERMFAEIGNQWVNLEPLLEDVEALLRLLVDSNVDSIWFYDPDHTLSDFQTLLETLELAKTRKATRIVIQFR